MFRREHLGAALVAGAGAYRRHGGHPVRSHGVGVVVEEGEQGEGLFIKPEGFDEMHNRGGGQHRLRDENKWKPLGIGSGETD